MITYNAKRAVAAALLPFVCPPKAVFLGFVLSNTANFHHLPEVNYISDPTPKEVKQKIESALKKLSFQGQQSVLVQYWTATKAGNTFLLTTTYQPSALYGTYDEGLHLYHTACLHNKLYVNENVSFGLPGLAFKKGTRQQTQDIRTYYPRTECPPCENDAIFSMKEWGSFAIPVVLAKECGVFEVVLTKQMHSYDGIMNVAEEILMKAGFKCSIKRDAPKETKSSKKRQRETPSSKYALYNVLAPYFGLSKAEAMKKVNSKFPSYDPIIESTFTNALRAVRINEWPYIRKRTTRVSCAPETLINPTEIRHQYSEVQFMQDDIVTTPLTDQTSCVTSSSGTPSARGDEGVSKISWEHTTTSYTSFKPEFDGMKHQGDNDPFKDDFDEDKIKDLVDNYKVCCNES